MAGVQRTPPKTPRSQSGNITQSEPDITMALSEFGYVNINRNKRPHNDNSPPGESGGVGLHELLQVQVVLAKWKKEQDERIAELLADQTTLITKLSSDISDIK